MNKELFELAGNIACVLSIAIVPLAGYIFLALLIG